MQYYRCKCGMHEAWGSMPPARCTNCSECGSNLAVSPNSHTEPVPHEWVTRYDTITGIPYKICQWCNRKQEEVEI